MLEENIKKTEKKSGSPTQKQLEYLKRLAAQTGEDLNKYNISTFDDASRMIETLQKKIPPTDKQIAFAKKLAAEHNFDIPPEALQSKVDMSKWLEKVSKDDGGDAHVGR